MPNILDEIPVENELENELDNLEEDKEEKETPSESSTDDKTDDKESDDTDDKKDEEENLPFHKHPRWKAINDKNKELELEMAEMRGKLDGLSSNDSNVDEVPDRPEWFTKLYGDDDELWKSVHKEELRKEAEIEARLTRKFEDRQANEIDEETREDREALEYVNNSIQDLKDSGEKFNNKELIAVVKEYQPTDDNGNLDFNKGLKMLKEFKKVSKESSDAKKELADTTTSKSPSKDNDEPVNTTKSLRHMSW